MEPLVSIVIPVYNGEDYMDEAIRSAINQTYKNIEIIVVNDGSTDRTEEIALSYGDKIRYFHKPNGGVASALNLAIREMRGEYFSWLSHDDYYLPEKVEREVEAIRNQEDKTAIVYCDYSLLDQKTGILSPYKIEDYYAEMERANGILMLMQRKMGGCTMLIHFSHFQRVGMFDEKLRTTQDYDMWFRMLRGQKVVHVPQLLTVARVHEKQGSQTIKIFDSERERLFLHILKELTETEKLEIWGSEYCCLQNFLHFFETYNMQDGCGHVRGLLQSCAIPDDAAQMREKAKKDIYRLAESEIDRVAIFGAGSYGRRVLRLLRSRGIQADVFWDNDPQKWETEIEGIPCISVKEGLKNKTKTLVILAAELYGGMQRQMEEQQVPNIITEMHWRGSCIECRPCRRGGRDWIDYLIF